MTIEELLKMPIGKDNRTGGFQLTLKRARKTKELKKGYLQEVVFVDQTGEITGEVLLKNYVPLRSGQKIKVIVCWMQNGEAGKPRLYIDQWQQVTVTVDEYEAMREKGQNVDVDEDTVASMCRNSIAREYIGNYTAHHGEAPECTEERRGCLNRWLGYVLLGR